MANIQETQYNAPIANEGIYILDTASWRTVKPFIHKDRCINCGICLSYCPVCSIIKDESQQVTISYTYCKGCGICAHECPKGAISMIQEGGMS